MYITNSKGQPLSDHLRAVSLLSGEIAKELLRDSPLFERLDGFDFNFDDHERAQIILTAQVAGLYHDTGKLETSTQDFYRSGGKGQKFNAEGNLLHQELSYVLAAKLVDQKALVATPFESSQRDVCSDIDTHAFLYAIYWHHSRPYRKRLDGQGIDVDWRFLSNLSEGYEEDWSQKLAELGLCKTDFDHQKGIARGSDLDLESPLQFKKMIGGPGGSDFDRLAKKPGHQRIIGEYLTHNIKRNAINTLVRLALVCADRIVSSMSVEELESHVKASDWLSVAQSNVAPSRFSGKGLASLNEYLQSTDPSDDLPEHERLDDRGARQNEAAYLLSLPQISPVCSGAPGVGKTRIALKAFQKRHGLDNGKEAAPPITWICPRVDVCESVYDELTDKLENATIAIVTGKSQRVFVNGKEQSFRADRENDGSADHPPIDIRITTIDQVVQKLIGHLNFDDVVEFLSSEVIFDEFHEIFEIPTMIPFLSELLALKRMSSSSNYLTLISGTVNPLMLRLLPVPYEPVSCESFNDVPYSVASNDFEDVEDSRRKKISLGGMDSNSLTVINAVHPVVAHTLSSIDQSPLIFHSRVTPNDRLDLFDRLLQHCGRDSDDREKSVVSGPAAQASLNISRQHGVIEFSSPENTIQRVGRVNRFAENDHSDLLFFRRCGYVRGSSDNNLPEYNDPVLTGNGLQYLAGAFAEFFVRHFESSTPATVSDLAEFYRSFYDNALSPDNNDPAFKDLAKSTIFNVLQITSDKMANNNFEPVKRVDKKGESTVGLRGASLYADALVLTLVFDDQGRRQRIENDGFLSQMGDEPDSLANRLITITPRELTGKAIDRTVDSYPCKEKGQVNKNRDHGSTSKDLQILLNAQREPVDDSTFCIKLSDPIDNPEHEAFGENSFYLRARKGDSLLPLGRVDFKDNEDFLNFISFI